MELLVNDLSVQAQFQDISAFRESIGRVMAMRNLARRFGRELQCHRNLVNRQVTQALSMYQAIQTFTVDQKRALLQWLTQRGPFWEDTQVHGPNDYLECNDKLVTDHAVGEAAYCCLQGIERHLVSLIPSSWRFSPVLVTWMVDSGAMRSVEVGNHWDSEELEAVLQDAPVPIASWKQLQTFAIARFPNITFSPDAVEGLLGHPFAYGAALRVLSLLDTLDRLKCCFDQHGQRTPEGHRLYRDRFTGLNAWFSDSSDSEKNEFQSELTFRHPGVAGQFLFCTWHGKVNTPPLRVHFSWPVRADEPLYVVYVGPKITKR